MKSTYQHTIAAVVLSMVNPVIIFLLLLGIRGGALAAGIDTKYALDEIQTVMDLYSEYLKTHPFGDPSCDTLCQKNTLCEYICWLPCIQGKESYQACSIDDYRYLRPDAAVQMDPGGFYPADT